MISERMQSLILCIAVSTIALILFMLLLQVTLSGVLYFMHGPNAQVCPDLYECLNGTVLI